MKLLTRLEDYLLLRALFLVVACVVLIAVEAGYQLGRYRRRCSEDEREDSVGAIVGATLGLFAFILAFTFSMTASRFDSRRLLRFLHRIFPENPHFANGIEDVQLFGMHVCSGLQTDGMLDERELFGTTAAPLHD